MEALFSLKDNLASQQGKGFLLDTDFLSVLFHDENFFTWFVEEFEDVGFLIDPLVSFEFLRDVHLPEQRKIREEFISKDEVFIPIQEHKEMFDGVRDAAIELSMIYAHQAAGKKKNGSPSTVDLLLAARVKWIDNPRWMVLTGNRKDFPSFLFTLEGAITYEDGYGSIRTFSVLSLDPAKYKQCQGDLKKLQEEVQEG